jgi:DNA-binding LacI/PurR family transcriptional regulator
MKVRTLGLVMDRSLPAYQRALLEGVLAAVRAAGVNLRVFLGGKISEGHEAKGYSAIYRFAKAPAVGGLVVAASSIADADASPLFTRFLQDRGVPVCSVGLPEGGAPHVGVNADAGIEALCEHLTGVHGHRRFAMITGPASNVESRTREVIWRSALERRGLTLPESHVSHQSFRWRRGIDGVRQLLDERGLTALDIDVLVCLNDSTTLPRRGMRRRPSRRCGSRSSTWRELRPRRCSA